MSEQPEPDNFFEQRVKDKAQKENISKDEARRLLIQERNARLAGKFYTNPKSSAKVEYDAFGEKPKNITPEYVNEVVIDFFNKRYSFVTLPPHNLIYDHKIAKFIKIRTFRERWAHFKMNTSVPHSDGSLRPKRICQADHWLESADKNFYDGIECNPRKDTDPERKLLNMWRDFVTEPKEGDCSLTVQYIHDVVCDGNEDVFPWLMDYLAHMVQKPWEKPEVAIVMVGDKGVGKSFFTHNIVRRLVDGYGDPIHYFKTANPDHVFGKFTSQLDNTIPVSLEEVMWGGDRRHESKLKDLISSDTIDIEQKLMPVYTVANHMRIFMSSNSDWVVPASPNERRFLVLSIGTARQQDHPYFAAITNELTHGGMEALMYELMHRDITKFDFREAPKTNALLDQKRESMPDADKWWFDLLQSTQIYQVQKEPDDWICSGCKKLHKAYLDAMSRLGSRAKRLGPEEFGIKLRTFLPKVVNGKVVKSVDGRRVVSIVEIKKVGGMRCYVLPPLSVARQLWEFRIKGKVDWSEEDAWSLPEIDEM